MNNGINVEAQLPVSGGNKPNRAAGSCLVPVAEGYQRWAPIYDHTPNPLFAREERHLLSSFVDLGNKRVLDLACGTGRWLERLVRLGCESGVGVDCSVAMLRIAANKDAIAGRVAQAACEVLPFRTAVFDLAICSFALGHLPDLRCVVRELARVTKSGASVFVSDLHPEAYARGWRTGFRDESSAVQIQALPRSVEEIVQEFFSCGFQCLTCVPLRLGEPERPIFARAGKIHAFAEACRLHAVLVCHFRRLGSASCHDA